MLNRIHSGLMVVALLAEVVGCSPVGGLTEPTSEQVPTPASIVIDVESDPLILDGIARQRTTVPIVNSTTVPFHLAIFSSSCTCLEHKLPQSLLQPGETIELELEADLGMDEQEKRVSVTLETGVEAPRFVIVNWKLSSFPRLLVQPVHRAFGRVQPGTMHEQTIRISSAELQFSPENVGEVVVRAVGHEGLDVTRVSTESTVVEESIMVARSVWRVRLTLPEESNQSADRAEIIVEHGDAANRVGVSWEPARFVRAEPEKLFVGADRLHEASLGTIAIIGSDQFAITSIDIDHSRIACVAKTSGRQTTHELELNRTGELESQRVTILKVVVGTDHHGASIVEVPVYIFQRTAS